MAQVWQVYEGREPTRGSPWLSLHVDDAIDLLDLKPECFISGPKKTPRFGPQDTEPLVGGYRHIVVEIDPTESRPPEWRAGFYRSPLRPEDARERMMRELDSVLWKMLTPIIGVANVVRLKPTASNDSLGRDTLAVMVVLAPGAMQNMTGEIGLTAAGRLQALMQGLGFEGTPSLHYATEAELVEIDR